jgi:hypothetical protein
MTSETTLREYIVTLHNFDDLESFYVDMETPGGNLYIPNREVNCHLRRPISRNTHYLLNDQEAAQLQNDPRVLAVELTLEERGLKIEPVWTQQSSRWSKLETVPPTVPAQYQVTSGQYNWGLLRATEGVHRPNWGSPRPIWRFGTITPGAIPEVEGTVTVPFSGKNVDVVILDGMLEAGHPEFAKNSDGTLRVIMNIDSPGEKLTKKLCDNHGKPMFDIFVVDFIQQTNMASLKRSSNNLHVWTLCDIINTNDEIVEDFVIWARDENIQILNVAGNSAMTCSNMYDVSYPILDLLFKRLRMN